MKVLILIPVFKRPEVLEIMLNGMDRFIGSVSWEIMPVFILSPDDPDVETSEKLIKQHGWKRIYYKNLPVSNKINAGIEYVVRKYHFDYLMNFGSDDLIHPDIESLYEPYLRQKFKFFGINTLYFYELGTKRSIFFDTYNTNGSIGAGRMIHYSILHDFVQQCYPLYEPGLDSGMDCSSALMIKRVMNQIDVIIDSGRFPYIVDIKTNTNINHMMHIESRRANILPVESEYLTKYHPILNR